MRTRISKLTSGGALMAIAALTVALSFASAQTADETQSSHGTIRGVWRTMVTPVNCETGGALVPAFPGLFTFHKGGTMSEYGIGPGSNPALRSPGHGLWQRVNDEHYSFTFIFYRYDTSGIFIGSQKITASLKLGESGNEFTTRSTIKVFDANDNLIGTGCATAVGTRFARRFN